MLLSPLATPRPSLDKEIAAASLLDLSKGPEVESGSGDKKGIKLGSKIATLVRSDAVSGEEDEDGEDSSEDLAKGRPQ